MLNASLAMLRRTAVLLALALVSLVGGMLASRRAFAQTTTTTTSGPSINIVGQSYPNRWLPSGGNLNGTELGESTRPQGLNPFGISYQDCITDQTLQFPLQVSGFDGQNLEVWASVSGDCTNDINRGFGGVALCWPVGAGLPALNYENNTTVDLNVRVQDIVAYQSVSPTPTTYQRAGPEACSTQQSFTPVSFTVFFIPVLSNQDQGGSPYEYQVTAGLLGPPAPVGVSIADGDTLFVVNWTPNIDTETIGYDLFIDPPIGTAVDAAASTYSLVCDTPDGTTVTAVTTAANVSLDGSQSPDASEGEDGGEAGEQEASTSDAAIIDATVSDATVSDAAPSDASPEASCHYANVSGSAGITSAGACNDKNLTAGTTVDGGVEVFEDADIDGDIDGEAVSTTTTVSGGINQINSKYAIAVPEDGLNAAGEATQSYTITGLTNGTTYTVVVSAVDAFGNIGPPSNEACDYPAPVNDFWTLYRQAGGQAGGLCALEAVGAPASSTVAFGAIAAMVLSLVRRRRSRR
jgi:hypothetical protein